MSSSPVTSRFTSGGPAELLSPPRNASAARQPVRNSTVLENAQRLLVIGGAGELAHPHAAQAQHRDLQVSPTPCVGEQTGPSRFRAPSEHARLRLRMPRHLVLFALWLTVAPFGAHALAASDPLSTQ